MKQKCRWIFDKTNRLRITLYLLLLMNDFVFLKVKKAWMFIFKLLINSFSFDDDLYQPVFNLHATKGRHSNNRLEVRNSWPPSRFSDSKTISIYIIG